MHEVDVTTTVVFSLLLGGMVLALAFEEKLHVRKSFVTGAFAITSLLLASAMDILPEKELTRAGAESSLNIPIYIQAIDWSVIAIIFGSSLFVDITSRSGLFTWIALRMTKLSKGDPLHLLAIYGVMTVIFSALLNNVTAMIIVGSLTAVSLEKLEREQMLLPFFLVEGLLTNVGGLLTLISSVPNIIVGQAANISFTTFFIVAAPYVVIATALTVFMASAIFKIGSLNTTAEKKLAAEKIKAFDERDGIESRGFFAFAAIMLVVFIVSIAAASVSDFELGMGFVAIACAVVMMGRYRHQVERFYGTLDWDLLLFFAFLFVVIFVMEEAQVLHILGGLLAQLIDLNEQTDGLGTGTALAATAVASAVTDNIPLAAMLAKIFSTMTLEDSRLWWSVIFGTNLGGNITPIGSASTVVAVTLMAKHKLPINFMGFVLRALPFAAVQIALGVVYVLYLVPLIVD